jgi:hypothetical protein
LEDNLQALYPNIADFSATEPSATEPIAAEKNPDAFVARVIGVERTGLTIAPEGLLELIRCRSAAAGFVAMRKRVRPSAIG